MGIPQHNKFNINLSKSKHLTCKKLFFKIHCFRAEIVIDNQKSTKTGKKHEMHLCFSLLCIIIIKSVLCLGIDCSIKNKPEEGARKLW